MPLTFKNAPLTELIAELRWNQDGVPPPPAPGPGMQQIAFGMYDSAAAEEFFMRFGAQIHGHGFSSAERIVPPGFPTAPFQVIYRYKKAAASKEILQVGPGVFSANALKPYQSWHVFRPAVAIGIDALLEARAEGDKATAFSAVSLRYINAFGPELSAGRDSATFMRDVLGIKTEIPPAVMAYAGDGAVPDPTLNMSLALKDGQKFRMMVGDGVVAGTHSLILDMTVSTFEPTAPTREAALTILDSARNKLHEIFLHLTKGIEDLMEPVNEDA